MNLTTITRAGNAYTLFPFAPDWNRPPQFTRQWFTTVATGLDGTECRTAMSPRPMMSLAFTVTPFDNAEANAMLAALAAIAVGGYAMVPIWGRGCTLAAPVAEAATVLTMEDATLWGWREGDAVFLRTPGPDAWDEWDIGLIETIDGNELTLVVGVDRAYSVATKVYPVLSGSLTASRIDQLTDHHPVVEVQAIALRDGSALLEDANAPLLDDEWGMPLRPLSGTIAATDETVTGEDNEQPVYNEDGTITLHIKGGEPTYTIVSQDGLGTMYGHTVTFTAGRGDYCFDITDGNGDTIELCVHVYREAWSITYDNPYIVQVDNQATQEFIDLYGTSDAYCIVTHNGVIKNFQTNTLGSLITPWLEKRLYILGPESSYTNNQTWNEAGASHGFSGNVVYYGTTLPSGTIPALPPPEIAYASPLRLVWNGNLLTSYVWGPWTDSAIRE